MTSAITIRDSYRSYFLKLIAEYQSSILSYQPEQAQANRFITITFKRNGGDGGSLGSMEMKAFKHFYQLACSEVIGRHYQQKRHQSQLPLALAFLDAEGTRCARGPFDHPTNLHLHTVWTFNVSNVDSFDATIKSFSFLQKIRQRYPYEIPDVENVDRPSKELIDYSSKLMFLNRDKGSDNDFRILPTWASEALKDHVC